MEAVQSSLKLEQHSSDEQMESVDNTDGNGIQKCSSDEGTIAWPQLVNNTEASTQSWRDRPKKPRKQFRCNLCKGTFTSKIGLRLHVAKMHTEQTADTTGGPLATDSSSSRRKKCHYCDRKFFSSNEWLAHLRSGHQRKNNETEPHQTMLPLGDPTSFISAFETAPITANVSTTPETAVSTNTSCLSVNNYCSSMSKPYSRFKTIQSQSTFVLSGTKQGQAGIMSINDDQKPECNESPHPAKELPTSFAKRKSTAISSPARRKPCPVCAKLFLDARGVSCHMRTLHKEAYAQRMLKGTVATATTASANDGSPPVGGSISQPVGNIVSPPDCTGSWPSQDVIALSPGANIAAYVDVITVPDMSSLGTPDTSSIDAPDASSFGEPSLAAPDEPSLAAPDEPSLAASYEPSFDNPSFAVPSHSFALPDRSFAMPDLSFALQDSSFALPDPSFTATNIPSFPMSSFDAPSVSSFTASSLTSSFATANLSTFSAPVYASFDAPATCSFGTPTPFSTSFAEPTSFGPPALSPPLFGLTSPSSTSFSTPVPSSASLGAPASSFATFGSPASSSALFGAPSPTSTSFAAPISASASFAAPISASASFAATISASASFAAPISASSSFAAPISASSSFAAPASASFAAPASASFTAPASSSFTAPTSASFAAPTSASFASPASSSFASPASASFAAPASASFAAPASASFAAPASTSFAAPASASFAAPASSLFAAPTSASFAAPASASFAAPASTSFASQVSDPPFFTAPASTAFLPPGGTIITATVSSTNIGLSPSKHENPESLPGMAVLPKRLTHNDACPVCGKTFRQWSNTLRHLYKIHGTLNTVASATTQSSSFPATEKTLSTKRSSKSVMSKPGHARALPGAFHLACDWSRLCCSLCARRFGAADQLERHVRTHFARDGRSVRLFRCPLCDFEALGRRSGASHLATSHTPLPQDRARLLASMLDREVLRPAEKLLLSSTPKDPK
uniref:C2H2-type domain-containing protein n=1 Tax=Eptatretus burgeri TaxID=7764 RepID=A0A8C4NN54_EPTBU